jgi:hypothetical protein
MGLSTGSGGSGEGVVAALDETAGGVSLQHGAGSTLELKANFDMSDGEWSFPVAHDKWSAVAVTYDKSSTANDAEARVDFVDVTVTPTSPTGSLAGINLGYCVGNIAGQTQGWDGRIAHVQIFNRILTTEEKDACLQAPGSVRDGLKLWLPMTNASDIEDRSGNNADGSATQLTTDISGPAITAQPGALPGITILNAGWIPVTQHVIPRFANGKTHPAGQVRGQGMISVIQGTEYGLADGSNPQRIVVTEDWDEEILRQWDFGPADDGEDPPTQLEEAVPGLSRDKSPVAPAHGWRNGHPGRY